jgi:hypothetical protein
MCRRQLRVQCSLSGLMTRVASTGAQPLNIHTNNMRKCRDLEVRQSVWRARPAYSSRWQDVWSQVSCSPLRLQKRAFVNACVQIAGRMALGRAAVLAMVFAQATFAAASTGSEDRSPLSLIPAPLFLILVAVVHVLCIFVGRRELQRIAGAWCTAFAGPQGVLSRNFAVWGSVHMSPPDSQLFWQPSPATFKLWCSGRRNCSGALFTLGLRKRHNLFNNIANIVKRG